jgi:ATP-dependent DNA ligase
MKAQAPRREPADPPILRTNAPIWNVGDVIPNAAGCRIAAAAVSFYSPLPEPILARSGPLPAGDYSLEVKWDGFRAIVATDRGLRVLSRRGWDMNGSSSQNFDGLPSGVFDGELVSFEDRLPTFPLVCQRLLIAIHGSR